MLQKIIKLTFSVNMFVYVVCIVCFVCVLCVVCMCCMYVCMYEVNNDEYFVPQ